LRVDTKDFATVRPIRELVGLIVATVATALLVTASPAEAKYASLILDADSGRVLHAVNADTRNYPASLTKMMTLYLVFDALEDGRLHLDKGLKVTTRAAGQPASRLGLQRGEKITVEEAILALVTKSANDVATVLAESLAGSERNFALVMTAKARKLGMSRTTFRNASGLPNRGQLSTARDMSVLARALLRDHARYYHYFSTDHFTFSGATHANHNGLLTTYKGTDGIKTGYIRASGFNLVASVKRGGQRLIGVMFGGSSPNARNRLMKSLLDKGFASLASIAPVPIVRRPTEKMKVAKVKKVTKVAKVTKNGGSDANRRPAGDWGIQVGVYKTREPAYEIARKAVTKAPDILEGGRVTVVLLEKRNRRPLYRGRVLGIGKSQAYQACRVLKRQRMHCMELRMTDDVAIASAN
jgi:D-alanyl-D-alanine carboxypeptidase